MPRSEHEATRHGNLKTPSKAIEAAIARAEMKPWELEATSNPPARDSFVSNFRHAATTPNRRGRPGKSSAPDRTEDAEGVVLCCLRLRILSVTLCHAEYVGYFNWVPTIRS